MFKQNKTPNKLKSNNIEVAKIDSLTILIPLNGCKIIDTSFLQRCDFVAYVRDTAERIILDEDKQRNVIHTDNNGIKTRFAKCNRMWGGENIEFIQTVITSKHLKSDYFQGINDKNIFKALEYIKSLQIIDFVIDDVLDSNYYADIDFCIDYELNEHEYKHMLKMMKQNVLPKKEKHIKSFKSNLQLSSRQEATLTSPFVKVYDKHKEFIDRDESAVFNQEYLFSNEIYSYNIKRLEVTLKASKDKKHHNIDKLTLRQLLSLSEPTKQDIIKNTIKHYYTARTMEDKEGLKPMNQVIANYLSYLIDNCNMCETELLSIGLRGIDDKIIKSRMKKQVLKSLNSLSEDTQKNLETNSSRNAKPNDILKELGVIKS